MLVKRYTYECDRCGVRFGAPSPAMHLLSDGHVAYHCGERARVVHVEEVDGDADAARAAGHGPTGPARGEGSG